jgi:hypothetical protein
LVNPFSTEGASLSLWVKTTLASLKKVDFNSGSPLFKGVKEDLKVPKVTAKNFSNNL